MTDSSYFKNMLVPVDGSRFSLQAEEVATDIAKKFNSKVIALYVVPHAIIHPPSYRDWRSEPMPDSLRKEMEGWFSQKGKQALGEAKMLFAAEKVQVETILEEFADPPETILDVAREKRSDLVVIGNRGASEIEDFTLGGVAEKVMRHVKCPILIVKKRNAMLKILVGIDGSRHAQKALKHAVVLAAKFNSSVTLLNVSPPMLPHIKAETVKSEGNRIVSDASAKVKGLKVDKRVEIGNAAKTILDVAKKENYDLIALGSRGLNPVRRFLLGGVSDKVARHAQCSVLIVK